MESVRKEILGFVFRVTGDMIQSLTIFVGNKISRTRARKEQAQKYIDNLIELVEADYEVRTIIKDFIISENQPSELKNNSKSVDDLLRFGVLMSVANLPRKNNTHTDEGYTFVASYGVGVTNYKIKSKVYEFIKDNAELKQVLEINENDA